MEKEPKVIMIESMLRERVKIFTKNDEAIHYCSALKTRGRMPYKYVIVTWDDIPYK